MRFLYLICCYLMLNGQTPETVKFNHSNEITSAYGRFTIDWGMDDFERLKQYQLEVSSDSNFVDSRVIYQGSDRQYFTSGLKDGDYYYRVRQIHDVDSIKSWSKPLKLTVQHQSLDLALLLFGIGLIVSISTAYVIINGSRREEENLVH